MVSKEYPTLSTPSTPPQVPLHHRSRRSRRRTTRAHRRTPKPWRARQVLNVSCAPCEYSKVPTVSTASTHCEHSEGDTGTRQVLNVPFVLAPVRVLTGTRYVLSLHSPSHERLRVCSRISFIGDANAVQTIPAPSRAVPQRTPAPVRRCSSRRTRAQRRQVCPLATPAGDTCVDTRGDP